MTLRNGDGQTRVRLLMNMILGKSSKALACRCLLIVFAVFLILGDARSQTASPPPPASETAAKLGTLAPQERTELIAKLDDSQVRELLLYYLDKTASRPAPQQQSGGGPEEMLRDLSRRGDLMRANLIEMLRSVVDLPAAAMVALRKLAAGEGAVGLFVRLVALAAFILSGALAEWIYWHAAWKTRAGLEAVAVRGEQGWLRSTTAVLLLDVVGIASFTLGYVLAFLTIWEGNEHGRELAAAILIGILVVRLTRAVAIALVCPDGVGERLIPVSQVGAKGVYQALYHTSLAGVILLAPAYLLGNWSGSYHVRILLMTSGGAAFVAYAAWQVWSVRYHIAEAMLSTRDSSRPASWAMRGLSHIWAPLIIAYLAAVYIFGAASALAGVPIGITRAVSALLVVLIGLPVADRAAGLLFESRSRYNPDGLGGHSRLVFRRATRIVLAIAAVLAVLGIFGLHSVLTRSIGAWLIQLTLNIGLVVLIAYVLRELTIAWISRRLAQESQPGATRAGSVDIIRASRLRTILPLVQRALQVTILTIATLMILSAFGVSIGPLLAGAGVIGLAVGFGSQTLVKDLISGMFFLLDDAFRVGEYIEIEGFSGEVERINVRSLALRTPLGAIHTVPFGGINAVANYSRDWAIVKLEFRVTYDTDMNKVKKIFRKIGEDLMQDPELGPGFLQPFKFQGVKAMEETGIVFRGKFMTLPGAQFQIRKAIFERVQKDFKEQGIKFAQRRVQVDLPPGLDLDEQTRATITNAAAAAVVAEPAAAPR